MDLRIGIDFDNTIVGYDELFHRHALLQGLIPSELPHRKEAVRDHLRANLNEGAWTELQGYVYGPGMREAWPFPGWREFMAWAHGRDIPVYVISHRTQYPYLGPRYDLHRAAREWLSERGDPCLSPERILFHGTKEEKLHRIAELRCTHFIDDLPEILLSPLFPAATQRLLFAPSHPLASTRPGADLAAFASWAELQAFFARIW